MKKKISVTLLTISSLLVLSGCEGQQNETEAAASSKLLIGKSVATPAEDKVSEPIATDEEILAEKAITDLAGRLDISPVEISLIRSQNVTWRSGALGCRKKGMSYTQALVPGLLIVLRAGEAEYNYHSGNGGDPFYCTNSQLPLSATTAE